MPPSPRLACIVLAHGEAGSLDRAVASVLEQEPGIELVVVHSGGASPRLAAGVELLHSSSLLLPGAARNRGVAATEAPFVAFLAADCRALPGWVAGRIREHAAGADAVADVLEPPPSPVARAAWLLQHRRRTARTPSARRLPLGLSYRRELLVAAGPFDEDLRQGEDSALNAQLLALGARVAYPTDVRIAHVYPQTARAVLADARARGARRVAAERAISGSGRARILREALHAFGDAPQLERDPRVLVLTAASVVAYAAGALQPVTSASRGRAARARAGSPSRR
jgi:glycosyltransferase involved in cell wall biosynthesis